MPFAFSEFLTEQKTLHMEHIEDEVLRSALDFLSTTTATGGTSLVALNLNFGQKALLKQSEDGSDYIEMNFNTIHNDMNKRNSTSKNRKDKTTVKTRKRREELSISASKSIKKEKVEIIVDFK